MSVTPDGKGRQAMISAIRKKGIEAKRQGYTLVLILDNAQNIPELVTRDLKTIVSEDFGLSNCMALVLSGTREFKSVLRLPENKSLQMDTTLAYTMKGLSEEETKQYVKHKIQKAGGSPDIIDPQVLEDLYSLCFNGNCKAINGVNLTKSTENSVVKPNIRSGPHCSHCSVYKCYFRMISPIDREFISIT